MTPSNPSTRKGPKPLTWSFEEIQSLAARYASKTDWRKDHPRSYRYALKMRWMTRLYFRGGKRSYTLDELITRRSYYSSNREWSKRDPKAYRYARNKGILTKIPLK